MPDICFLSFPTAHRIPPDNQHSTHQPSSVPIERRAVPEPNCRRHPAVIIKQGCFTGAHPLCRLTTSLVPHGHTD